MTQAKYFHYFIPFLPYNLESICPCYKMITQHLYVSCLQLSIRCAHLIYLSSSSEICTFMLQPSIYKCTIIYLYLDLDCDCNLIIAVAAEAHFPIKLMNVLLSTLTFFLFLFPPLHVTNYPRLRRRSVSCRRRCSSWRTTWTRPRRSS